MLSMFPQFLEKLELMIHHQFNSSYYTALNVQVDCNLHLTFKKMLKCEKYVHFRTRELWQLFK